jgi:16S rRNA (guanine966-N2)-methyltransferase
VQIISGKYNGRKLISPPKSNNLRPTSSKNLKNIINILYSGNLLNNLNIDISQIKLLDLFAGTGIFSFENLSQNILSATLIDINQKNLDIINQNAKIIDKINNVQTIRYNLKNSLPKLNQKYHLIFADPPYNQNLMENIFLNLENSNYLEKNHLIIIELDKKEELKFNSNKFKIIKEKAYGNSKFIFLQKYIYEFEKD